jgi:hypothetical protein
MGYVQGNVAREAGRLIEWKEHFWSRRYQSIPVSHEAAAQVEVFEYIMGHGVKEFLVERVLDWPGVHSARSLLTGEPMTGVWFNRTQEYAARRRGEDFDKMKYATPEVLTFDPLPCWAHLSEERRRERVAEVIERIDAAAAARIAATGKTPPGPAVVRNQRPHDQTNRPKRSPAPLFHAATKAMRQEMWDAYAWFVGAFRQAARTRSAPGDAEVGRKAPPWEREAPARRDDSREVPREVPGTQSCILISWTPIRPPRKTSSFGWCCSTRAAGLWPNAWTWILPLRAKRNERFSTN